jgi:hypothetical protein
MKNRQLKKDFNNWIASLGGKVKYKGGEAERIEWPDKKGSGS